MNAFSVVKVRDGQNRWHAHRLPNPLLSAGPETTQQQSAPRRRSRLGQMMIAADFLVQLRRQRDSTRGRRSSRRSRAAELRRSKTAIPLEIQEDEDYVDTKRERPIDRWRRVARMVVRIIGVCSSITSYAIDAGLILDTFTVTRSVKVGDEEVTFDPNYYRPSVEFMWPQRGKAICAKSPAERSDSDLLSLFHWLRSLPSFRNYTRDVQLSLCRVVRYENINPNRVLMRKGHLGYTMYFLFSGRVAISFNTDPDAADIRKKLREGKAQGIHVLTKGASFGEAALLREGVRRTATILCLDHSELIAVDQDDFVGCGLHHVWDRELQKRRDFFRSLPLLADASDQTIEKLAEAGRTEEYNHSKLMVPDATLTQWLWFVNEGKCSVWRRIELKNNPDFSMLFSAGENKKYCVLEERKDEGSSSVKLAGARARPKTSPTVRGGSGKDTMKRRKHENLNVHFTTRTSPEPRLEEGEEFDRQMGLRNDRRNNPVIYVVLDEIKQHECFSLKWIDKTPKGFSLVSRGTQIVRVPKEVFNNTVGERVLERLRFIPPYPPDSQICSLLLTRFNWHRYKMKLVAETVWDSEERKARALSKRDDASLPRPSSALGTLKKSSSLSASLSRIRDEVEQESCRLPTTNFRLTSSAHTITGGKARQPMTRATSSKV